MKSVGWERRRSPASNTAATLMPVAILERAQGSSATLLSALDEHLRLFMQLESQGAVLAAIAERMVRTLRAGGKILFCGNGGSAADAQHLAAELVGRFRQARRGLAAIALTTDTSVLTSIANDYGYSEVFRRQVEALGQAGDMLIGLSTSGSSENVCAAMAEGCRLGLYGVAMVGGNGGRLAELADSVLCVASSTTARVQEAHLFCGHVLCELVEGALLEAQVCPGRQAELLPCGTVVERVSLQNNPVFRTSGGRLGEKPRAKQERH